MKSSHLPLIAAMCLFFLIIGGMYTHDHFRYSSRINPLENLEELDIDGMDHFEGPVYEFGHVAKLPLYERKPAKMKNCSGDIVNGFKTEARDTTIITQGRLVHRTDLLGLGIGDKVYRLPAGEAPMKQGQNYLGAWIGELPLMTFFLVVLTLLALLSLAAYALANLLRNRESVVPPTPATPAPTATAAKATPEPDEFEGFYESGDTTMSIWIKGPRPQEFVFSYQKGDASPEKLTFNTNETKKPQA